MTRIMFDRIQCSVSGKTETEARKKSVKIILLLPLADNQFESNTRRSI